MARFQRGSLRRELRSRGDTWVLRFNQTRESDGKRVERTFPIGLLRNFPSESSAWAEGHRLDILSSINNKPDFKSPKVTFGMLADRFITDELGEHHLVTKRAHSTKHTYKMYLRLYLKPRWSTRVATKIGHVEIQQWLKQIQGENDLSDPTLHRIKQLMGLVYAHGHWTLMIPKACNPTDLVRTTSVSSYEPKVLEPDDSHKIFLKLKAPENGLVLLLATTGLRISEALGLKWGDVRDGLIHVSRSWTMKTVGDTKSAASKTAVPCSQILSEYLDGRRHSPVNLYSKDTDWVFASSQRKGASPRSGGMMVRTYIKQTALDLGLIKPGERLGAHAMRHGLATFLASLRTDPKTIQGLMRHSDVNTTFNLYVHGRHSDRLEAHTAATVAFFPPVSPTVQ
jgi:integrase